MISPRVLFAATVPFLVLSTGGCCLSAAGEGTGAGTSSGEAVGSTSGGEATGATSGGEGTGSTSGGLPCSPDGGLLANEFAGCATNADCDCPLGCVSDPRLNLSLCERACQTTGDCPRLDTVCTLGACTPVLCGGDFGGELFGVCGYGDAGIYGTCVPPEITTGVGAAGPEVGLCSEGGGNLSGCTPGLTRAEGILQACAPGEICSVGVCTPPCNPAAPAICVPMDSCVVFNADNPRVGYCRGNGDSGYTCNPAGAPCVDFASCCSRNCKAGQCQ